MTPLSDLCGVRFTRGGPVHYVAAGGLRLTPGQLVVVAHGADDALATVVIGSDQLVEIPTGLTASGRVMRIASSEEQRAFGRRGAAALRFAQRASEPCLATGTEILDSWLSPDGSRLTLMLSSAPARGDVLARELTALLGVAVALRVRDAAGNELPASGVAAAGLPPGGTDWLVPPGADAAILDATTDGPAPTAGSFIERLFPAADNWPPPRRRRQQSAQGEPEGAK